MLSSKTSSKTHKTTRPTEIKRSEKMIQSLTTAFEQFLNPFKIGLLDERKNTLFCLSSGMPANEGVTADLLQCVSNGEAAASAFLQNR